MFPDAKTFQDFKKQRDYFYEMVRKWESEPDKDFSAAVIFCLNIQEHPINMQHFARYEKILTTVNTLKIVRLSFPNLVFL